MDTIFMNSENSETSDSHGLLLNLTDKINLKRSDNYVALSNLSIYHTWKNIKKSYKNRKFKISDPTWNEELRITFKIKTRYYLELLTPETMKLLGSTKRKIGKDEKQKTLKMCLIY